jgi:hypothetical protein
LGLEDEDRFAQIPSLNDASLVSDVPAFSLVRYRAMVQDTFEPEYYTPLLEQRPRGGVEANGGTRLVTTKYRETAVAQPGFELREVDGAGLATRGVCYCVPLPAEGDWARGAAERWAADRCASSTAAAPKAATAISAEGAGVVRSAPVKRSRPDEDVDMGDGEAQRAEFCADFAAGKSRQRVAGSDPVAAPVAQSRCANEFGLNFPLPDEERYGRGASAACIVKLYDADAESLRICDIIEVVGVLCVDPEMAEFGCFVDHWQGARNPSTALVPRVHALLVRKLPFFNPLMPYSAQWFTEARLAESYPRSCAGPQVLAAVRETAVASLTGAVAGDTLAAQYLLLVLVSRTFVTRGLDSLGSWSLSLASWPEALPVSNLQEALGSLVPRCAHLKVTAETLNSRQWYPRKDEEVNRLVAGQLQLAPGTVVLIDETAMSEGQLEPRGVKAIMAIGTLIKENTLTFDYMYDVKVPLELTPVVVTSRKRSIVKEVSVTLPVRPAVGVASAAGAAENLEAVRLFLALVTRAPKPVDVPQDTQEKFGEDFSNARQRLDIPTELCGTWLCLARAYCLWQGEHALNTARWANVLELESQRLERCREDGLLRA